MDHEPITDHMSMSGVGAKRKSFPRRLPKRPHEADGPNGVVDFFDSEFLAGQHSRDVDLPIDADTAARRSLWN